MAFAEAAGTAAAQAPIGWDAAIAGGNEVQVEASSLNLKGGELSGLTLRGAWVLKGNRPEFGGFSGLVVRDGHLYSVSDQGWWLSADLAKDSGQPILRNARMAPVRDPRGRDYDKSGGDAEGLSLDRDAVGDVRLAVSFERDHRVMWLEPDGRLGKTRAPDAFNQLHGNAGIEALAELPDGGLIALAEGRDGDFAPVFVLGADGSVVESRLQLSWLHSVTGGDVGPDGKLYLVLREYSVLFGISIRVVRYRLAENGLPVPDSAETLAAYEAASGIDNMEGISVEPRPDGTARLWLISDDNFRGTQRTVLIEFDITQ
jgi:hypothetical protein